MHPRAASDVQLHEQQWHEQPTHEQPSHEQSFGLYAIAVIVHESGHRTSSRHMSSHPTSSRCTSSHPTSSRRTSSRCTTAAHGPGDQPCAHLPMEEATCEHVCQCVQYSCGRAEQAAPLPPSSRVLPPETPALHNLQSMPCRVSRGTHKLRSHECSASHRYRVSGTGYRIPRQYQVLA